MSPNRLDADHDVEALAAAARNARSGCRCGTGRCGCPGSCAAIARKRSSQYGIVIEMPLDLVADVRCFARPRARELEGELHDAVDALAREHRLLEHDLALGALEHAAADRRVLAFGVLAHDDEVDVAGLAVGERRRECPASAGTGRRLTYWSKPRRNWISEPHSDTWSGTVAGQPTAPKKIASNGCSCVEPVLRHHPAVLGVVVAAPVEMRERELDAELARGGLEHAQPFGHDFLADAVARHHRDAMCAPCFPPWTGIVVSNAVARARRRVSRGASPLSRSADGTGRARRARSEPRDHRDRECDASPLPQRARNYWIGVVSQDHVAHRRRRRLHPAQSRQGRPARTHARRRRVRVLFAAHRPIRMARRAGVHRASAASRDGAIFQADDGRGFRAVPARRRVPARDAARPSGR